MKAGTHSIEVTAQLVMTRRELQLLHHIATFNHDEVANKVASSHYADGVTSKEVVEFFQALRAETLKLMNNLENAKTKLFNNP